MKVSTDSLIAALLHPRLYLMGNEDGGVELHCRDHFDDGQPFAYYARTTPANTDARIVYVTSVPALWAEAVKHLEAAHRTEPGHDDGL